MKKRRTGMLLFAALVGTVILGACSGNNYQEAIDPATTAEITQEIQDIQ